jgi:hypothetical protein
MEKTMTGQPNIFDDFPEHLWAAWISPIGSTYTNPVKVTALESCYWAETADEMWTDASWFASNGNQDARVIGWEQRGSYAVYASTDKAKVQEVIDAANQVALTVAGALGLKPVGSVKYRRD